jgi:hypothetical protein
MMFNIDLKCSNPATCILKGVLGVGGSSINRFTLPPCRATYRQTLQGDEWAMNSEMRLLVGKCPSPSIIASMPLIMRTAGW